MKDTVRKQWSRAIRLGYIDGMDIQQEVRLLTLNALMIISIAVTLAFIAINLAVGASSVLQSLFVMPVFLLVLYCNHIGKHKLAGVLVSYVLLLIVLLLALAERRAGTEYVIIAIGCCSVLIFDRTRAIASAFVVAFTCYAFYSWYDATHPFQPNPSVPYFFAQNSQMFISGLVVVAQSLVFRKLNQRYAAKLRNANDEVATINEELVASNEELQAFSENLDLMVRDKRAQLQAYMDGIDFSTYSTVSDLEGRFTKVNEQVLTTSGYSREDLIGNHYDILASGNHPDDFFLDRRKALMAGKVWRGEVEHKTKGGSLLWFDCIIIPIRDSEGSVKHFLTLGLPITEKKLHTKLQEDTLKLLEGIAFRASHKIKGPLARIKGLAQLVKLNLLGKDEFKMFVEKIVICSDELDAATGELVTYVYDHHEMISDKTLR